MRSSDCTRSALQRLFLHLNPEFPQPEMYLVDSFATTSHVLALRLECKQAMAIVLYTI